MAIETRIIQRKIVFGDWEVKEFIGSGSGGKTAVFRIVRKHEDWEENAALKVVNILQEVGRKEELAEAYQKEYDEECMELCNQAKEEIRLMNRLRSNPHIVDYFDFLFVDYQEDNVFGTDLLIRMELLESLWEERKKKGEYEESEVIKIGRDICKGLSFCHNTGIIHRDIKPANIFVTTFGDYKLGDFGIARMVDAGQKASTKMGTRAYAAPEQFMYNKEKYDNRVDIYSLGLTLYELTNHNRLPFAASAYVRESEIQQRIMGKEFPAPETANPALAAVIKKACAFEAEDRYASVDELEEALMAAEVGVFSEKTKEEKKTPGGKKETKRKQKEQIKEGTIATKEGRSGVAAAVVIVVTGSLALIALLLLLAVGMLQSRGGQTGDMASEGNLVSDVSPAQPEAGEPLEDDKIVEDAVYITSYKDTFAAITQSGDLYMWGENKYGQVGCGDFETKENPVFILADVASVYLEESHTAALTKKGHLYLWGNNEFGQIGNDSWERQATPELILIDVKEASLGYYHSGALCNNGDLYGWGNPNGNGTGTYELKPALIARDIETFSMGRQEGGAVTKNGDLYMWGGNMFGQVGNGTLEKQLLPVKIMEGVESVSIGDWVSAAVTVHGDLYMWGDNWSGQVGIEGVRLVEEPTYIMSNVSSLSITYNSSAAITDTGELYMWGYNSNRQIGVNKGNLAFHTPQLVCDDVKSVVLGEWNTAAIKTNNDLYMWGENGKAQINDSGLMRINTPVLVESGIKSVALGGKTTCAVDNNGKLFSWGEKNEEIN